MHLWELCIEVRGDSWGGERSSLVLVVMLLLVVMLVDVLAFVVLSNMQIIKDGGGNGRQSCRRCLKAT